MELEADVMLKDHVGKSYRFAFNKKGEMHVKPQTTNSGLRAPN